MNKTTVTLFLILVAHVCSMGANFPAQTIEHKTNPVIAHRGAWKSKNLPHNSLASLREAFALSVAGSEFDIQLSADGIPVIFHDSKYGDIAIEETDYAELKKLKLSNGEPIPTLEAFLKEGKKQTGTLLIAELKPSVISKERSLLFAEKVVAEVKKLHAEEWMVYISFDYDILKKIIELNPSAKTMYLNGTITPEQLKTDGIWGADYHYKVFQKNKKWLAESKTLGIKTNAWTVNDSQAMGVLLAQGIDFITTDEPEMLFEILESVKSPYQNLVWSDEFNYKGLPDSTKWNFATKGNKTGWGNNELQWYTEANPANAYVSDGILKITAIKEPTSGKNYSSARLTTKDKASWKYCKVEVRAKLPTGRGTWPAIWMMPEESTYGGWPKSGEIDIMEHVGFNPDTVFSTVHTGKFNHMIGTQVGKKIGVPTATTGFHVYSMEWEENEIRSYVDGIHYFTFENNGEGFESWPFDQPFHIILNLAIGGGLGGQKGVDDSLFPHVYEIDYVRVYQ